MINTLDIAERLSRNFGPDAGRELASVLDVYYQDLRQNVFQQEFRQLRETLAELAAAQARTEQRLETLIGRVDSMAAAQERTEQRFEALIGRVDALAAAQERTEQQLATLTVRVDALAAAQQRTEQGLETLTMGVDSLAAAQERTAEQLRQLIVVIQLHETRLSKLDGRTLESQFREKASAYLGRVMRGTRVVPVGDLADELDGVLTDEEWDDIRRSDVILKGRAMIGGIRQEVFAVVEVSVKIDQYNVERAARRAGLLRKKGWKSLAVTAGEEVSSLLIESAAKLGVAIMQNGHDFNWSEALAAA